VLFEQPAPGRQGQQVFIDVLLRGALVAQHLPSDEVLIRDHDTQARIRLRHALHLLESLAHVEKVLE
jgi:hypothetical protein